MFLKNTLTNNICVVFFLENKLTFDVVFRENHLFVNKDGTLNCTIDLNSYIYWEIK